jgi:hypothetical protein
MIKSIQYVSIGLIITMFVEGILTYGRAFDISNYGAFAWFVQLVIVTATVTTALRIKEEGK